MNKELALELIKLLAAIESWSFANAAGLPDYLDDRLMTKINKLTNIILKEIK